MAIFNKENKYKWEFANIGGSSRVKISKGDDVAHLGELDPKMWTVLSCPVTGLEIDSKSLSYMDCDGDGKLRINDITAIAKWVTDALKDNELILTGNDFLKYIEVAFGDDEVPYIRYSESDVTSGQMRNNKRILVNSRAMQFDVLRTNPCSYMWVSPLPEEVLEENGLVQRHCKAAGQFKDILISRTGYRFSKLDRAFLDKLFYIRNDVAYGD